MRVSIALLALGVAAVAGFRGHSERIVGGEDASIFQYPSIVSLLRSRDMSTYMQTCGGVILNSRSILTAAHCPFGDAAARWRVRVGSTYANSFGTVHHLASYTVHPQYNWVTSENDISVLRLATLISYSDVAQPAPIAGSNYALRDNELVWAAGWGHTYFEGCLSETLQHVGVRTVNQAVCQQRYSALRYLVSEEMLCTGWLDEGGRDQCQGDSGGPLYHAGVVVGLTSWGEECAHPEYPGVNVRISSFTTWIQANA